MADNNSPPPLMTDKELLMEDSAHSEIMAAAFEYADAYCSSGDEPRRYKAAIDNLRKTVRAEIARFSRGNYKAHQPQVEPDDGDSTSKAQYRRMFHAACTDLGLINEALGLDPEDGGSEPIIAAIEELRAALATTQPASAKFNAAEDAERLKSVARGLSYNAHSEAVWKHTIHEIATRLETSGYADATHAMRAGEQDDARHAQLWREHVSKLDALVTFCPTCCQGSTAKPEMTRDEVIFECGKAAGRSSASPVATQGEQLDAKRYRWLRDCTQLVWGRITPAGGVAIAHYPKELSDKLYLDAGIDAALSATTPPVAKEE